MGFHAQANTVRDPDEPKDLFPQAVLNDLALVIEQTVNKAGGTEPVARLLGKNKGRISEWYDPNHPAWPSLRQIINLERFAKVDWITQAMAALHDADLVKRGRAEAEGAVLIRLAAAAKEGGEAVSASAKVASLPACRKASAEAIREAHEAIRAHKELIAALEALIGEAA